MLQAGAPWGHWSQGEYLLPYPCTTVCLSVVSSSTGVVVSWTKRLSVASSSVPTSPSASPQLLPYLHHVQYQYIKYTPWRGPACALTLTVIGEKGKRLPLSLLSSMAGTATENGGYCHWKKKKLPLKKKKTPPIPTGSTAMDEDLGFRVWGLGFGVWGWGFRQYRRWRRWSKYQRFS